MKKRSSGHRFMAFILSIILILSLCPPALAEGDRSGAPAASVQIERTANSYPTLAEALIYAVDNDTLIVTGTLPDSAEISIEKSVTLTGGAGGGELNANLILSSGKSLTLGSGSAGEGILTINGGSTSGKYQEIIKVSKGDLTLQDGVSIQGPIYMVGATATGTFTGGIVHTDSTIYDAVNLLDGASLDLISGGTYYGASSCFFLHGEGTKIQTISGGNFSNGVNGRDRGVFYVESHARIETISGGQFEATTGPALVVIYNGEIGEITDSPSFVSNASGHSGLYLFSDSSGSGGSGTTIVEKISGGTFKGKYGFLAITSSGLPASVKIGEINGGTFNGSQCGMQVNSSITADLISGGTFSGKYGVLNTGTVKAISGGNFYGTGESGFCTFSYGTVGPISGGQFVGKTIGLESLGQYSTGPDTISGGVFYGDQHAVSLSKPVNLERSLTTKFQGDCRFATSTNTGFFNNNTSVTVTINSPYFMSTLSEPNAAVSGADFHYLTRKLPVSYDANGGSGSMATVEDEYLKSVSIAENEFTNGGASFTGWNTAADGSGTSYAAGDSHKLTAPLTLYAQWQAPSADYQVEHYQEQVDGSYALVQTETLSGEIGSTVQAQSKTFEHYHIANAAPGAILSGVVPTPPEALTLRLYYALDTQTVSYDLQGGQGADGADYTTHAYPYGASVPVSPAPTRPGYTFTGWSTQPNGEGAATQPGDTLTIQTEDITLYAQWRENHSSGSNRPTRYTVTLNLVDADGAPVRPHAAFRLYQKNGTLLGTYTTNDRGEFSVPALYNGSYYFLETDAPEGYPLDTNKYAFTISGGNEKVLVTLPDDKPTGELPPALNTTDHFKYVIGYPDGSVGPARSVTRAETVTMFYRLLTAARRDEIFTAAGSFTDLPAGCWYNKAACSMANGAYVTGYPDGTFGGDQAITRAEFVSIAARFIAAQSGNVRFTDVSDRHWAYQNISTAVSRGWVEGYPDGTFQPDQPITRAEAMAIINRMLGRGTDASGIASGFIVWPDNQPGAWYYYDILEATNDHTYTGSRPSEKWTGLTVDYFYDIDKYEH